MKQLTRNDVVQVISTLNGAIKTRDNEYSEGWEFKNLLITIGNGGVGIRNRAKSLQTLHFLYRYPGRSLRLL